MTLTTTSTKKEIANYIYNAFELRSRNDGNKFYCVNEEKLTPEEYKALQNVIYKIHNNLPNDTEYNWIHTVVSRLTDEDLDSDDYELDCYTWYELIYNNEIINAISFLDIDLSAPVDGSISDVVQEAFREYMQYATYMIHELICTIYDELQ